MTGKSFIFYKSWWNSIVELPSDIRLEVYESVIRYAFGETVEGLKPLAQVAFSFIKQDIDRAKNKYANIVERNHQNGAKGGRPRNPNNPMGFLETQRNPNDDDNDDVDGNVISTPVGVDSSAVRDNSITKAKNINVRTREKKPAEPTVVDLAHYVVSGDEWRTDFEAYLSGLKQCYNALRADAVWIAERKEFHPNVDIPQTIKKACVDFWGTKAGWAHKKKSKSKSIDWKQTLANAISQPQNKVYENESRNSQNKGNRISNEFREEILRNIGAI
jgi:hypothetical protein